MATTDGCKSQKDLKLRDNAAKFEKEKEIANLVLVRKRRKESEDRHEEEEAEEEEVLEEIIKEAERVEERTEREQLDETTEEVRTLSEPFLVELTQLSADANKDEERNRLLKLNLHPEVEASANKIFSEHLKTSGKIKENSWSLRHGKNNSLTTQCKG